MNKGFFVVFLGIVIGAMALIFLNQAVSPTSVGQQPTDVAQAPQDHGGDPSSGREQLPAAEEKPAEPATVERGQEPARPKTLKAEAAPPAASKPEPAPEVQPLKPGQANPEEPVREVAQAARPVVEPVSVPEAPKPALVRQESRKVDAPKPEPVKPEPAATVETPKTERAAAPVSSVPEEKPRGKNPVLKNISLHFKNNGMALRIEGDRQFSYKTFVLPSPDRYVVDLVGSWVNMRAPKVPSNQFIKSVRVGKQAGGPRLVMDLQRAPRKHNVVWLSPTTLEIQVE